MDRINPNRSRPPDPHANNASGSLSCTSVPAIEPQPDLPKHTWIYRRVALPVLALLRLGASPERLAWSLAIGFAVGINPILGSTTLACLLVAFLLRLNIAASQLANHIVYPLQLVLLIPFLRLGTSIFRTSPIPLSPSQLLHMARTRPIALSRQLWVWESHALAVWLILALVGAPLIAAALTPLLHRLQVRVEHHQYPLIPESLSEVMANSDDAS